MDEKEILQSLINAAVQRGLFKSSADVVAVHDAFNSLSHSAKCWENYMKERDKKELGGENT